MNLLFIYELRVAHTDPKLPEAEMADEIENIVLDALDLGLPAIVQGINDKLAAIDIMPIELALRL